MVDFPQFTMQEMLECGVHFGHKTRMWDPKMSPFIYGARNGLHIINLQKTVPLLFKALKRVDALIQKKNNAKILFVGTKRQASDSIKEFASRCGQFYVNSRWLGGMLTNWPTISKSIATLEEYEKKISITENEEEEVKYGKKEILEFTRKRNKLEKVLGGIRKMKSKPDLLFIIDTNKEHIAIKEAQKLKIPIIAIIDTNSKFDNIDYIIPGNDDSKKAITFYCRLFSDVILHALGKSFESSGISLEEMKEGQSKRSLSGAADVVTNGADKINLADAVKSSVKSPASSDSHTALDMPQETSLVKTDENISEKKKDTDSSTETTKVEVVKITKKAKKTNIEQKAKQNIKQQTSAGKKATKVVSKKKEAAEIKKKM